MPRARMIKPEYWNDEKLAKVSKIARHVYVGLWTNSDDYGVVKGNTSYLKCMIYPYDKDRLTTFKGWLKELEDIGRILPFAVNGEVYYHLPKFLTHQTINRPSKTRNPPPPNTLMTDSCKLQEDSGQLQEDSLTKYKYKYKEKYNNKEKNPLPLQKLETSGEIEEKLQKLSPGIYEVPLVRWRENNTDEEILSAVNKVYTGSKKFAGPGAVINYIRTILLNTPKEKTPTKLTKDLKPWEGV